MATYYGTKYNDVLAGSGNAADIYYGQQGDDKIQGGAGDDTLDGGEGADVLTGRTGSDTFVIGDSETYLSGSVSHYGDTITDFTAGPGGDILELNIAVAGGGFASVTSSGTTAPGVGFIVVMDRIDITSAETVAKSLTGLDIEPSSTVLLLAGDPTNSYIYKIEVNAEAQILAPKITLVAVLNAFTVDERTAFTADNLKLPAAGTENGETISGTAKTDLIYGLGGDDTIEGGGAGDKIEGGEGADKIGGGGGVDILHGGAGDDIIDGGAGADLITGGAGKDRFVFDYIKDAPGTNYGDTVTDFNVSDGDWLQFNAPVTGAAFASVNVEPEDGGGGPPVRLKADAGFVVIENSIDTASLQTIADGLANLIPQAHSTILLLIGDADNSAVYELTSGSETGISALDLKLVVKLTGFGKDDRETFTDGGVKMPFAGAKGPDNLNGTPGNDAMYGFEGDDRLNGGAGDDIVDGGGGNDVLKGADGEDRLYGGDGADLLDGGNGDDELDGGEGADMMFGGAGHDVLDGGNGDDELDGGGGDDVLRSGEGDDILTGGAGNDRLEGGEGADTYIFKNGEVTAETKNIISDDIVRPGGERHEEIDVLSTKGTNDFTGSVISGVETLKISGDGVTTMTGEQVTGLHNIVFGPGANKLNISIGDVTFKMPKISGFNPDFDEISIESGPSGAVFNNASGKYKVLFNGGGHDLVFSGRGDDIIFGGGRPDLIYGGGGDDIIFGGARPDFIHGGGGADIIFGGSGDDVVLASPGGDTVTLGGGDDTLMFTDFPGNTGNTGVEVSDFNGDGDDKIMFNGLQLDGQGQSHDTVKFSAEFAGQNLSRQRDTIYEFDAGFMTMADSDSAESALANAFSVIGAGGSQHLDVLHTSSHAFIMYDSAGETADAGVFYFSDSNYNGQVDKNELSILAFLREAGANSLRAEDFEIADYSLTFDTDGEGRLNGDKGDNWIYGDNGNDAVNGLEGDDRLHGLGGHDEISGGAGDDRLYGGVGDDILDGGKGDDVIKGGAGKDEIKGGDGNDSLNGGRGGDAFDGGAGDDTLKGGAGDDTLKGGAGDDTLKGGRGGDSLDGGEGDDVIKGGAGKDEIKGGDGDDILNGGEGGDSLDGGEGDDVIKGGAGKDEIKGGDGDDILNGGEGDDTIDGGSGNDIIVASLGADTVRMGRGDNTLRFTDWSHGGDTVEFFSLTGNDKIAFTGLSLETNGVTHTDVEFHTEAPVLTSADGRKRFSSLIPA